MQIPVLIEPAADLGFRAKAGEPIPLSADIATENPWLAIAGTHDPNDSLIQKWKEEMAAYRQEIEEDPSRP